jgi:uncharacterized protein YjdB
MFLKDSQRPITGYCIGYNSKYSYNSIYIATAQASYDPITGITITSPDNVTTLGLGTGLKLTSTVAPATANPYVSWTSDNDSAVSVDSFGNCTALAVGEATITATSKADAAKSGSLKLTVTERSALPLTMVSVSSLPTGWTWLGQNSAEFYGTSSGGGVKCSTVGDGVKSPIFTDSFLFLDYSPLKYNNNKACLALSWSSTQVVQEESLLRT